MVAFVCNVCIFFYSRPLHQQQSGKIFVAREQNSRSRNDVLKIHKGNQIKGLSNQMIVVVLRDFSNLSLAHNFAAVGTVGGGGGRGVGMGRGGRVRGHIVGSRIEGSFAGSIRIDLNV